MTNQSIDIAQFVRDFSDIELRDYTCFAGNFRDQRLEQGAMAEAAFWNAVVNICVEERVRRNDEIRRLEIMYRTGTDPHEKPRPSQD